MANTPLRRLRRYQDLLLLGGGFVVTLVAFLTFVFTAVYAVRQFLVDERRQFDDDRNLVEMSVRESETSIRRTASYIELSWPSLPDADQATYESFLAHGNRFVIAQPTTRSSAVFAADQTALANPARVRRYLTLAKEFAMNCAAVSISRNVDIECYIFSPDGSIVIVPARAVPPTVFRDAASFVASLNLALDAPSPSSDDASSRARKAVIWRLPFTDPLTGKTRLRLVTVARDEGAAFAVIMIDYDAQMLLRTLVSRNASDIYVLAAADGRVIARSGGNAAMFNTAEASSHGAIHRSALLGGEVGYKNGYFVMSAPVAGTAWTLLHEFSWLAVAAGTASQVVTAGLAAAIILGVVWSLLLIFRSRVFAPVLDDSERMLESEHLSRTVIHTVPVGLALVSRETGEWLLASPQMHEMVSRIQGGADVLARSLVARFGEFQRGVADGTLRQDFYFEGRDGIWIELEGSASQARYKGVDVLVAAFVDVAENRRLARELSRAMRAADSANQAKSAFLAAMSHEIRTPLNAILGNLELLAQSPLPNVQRDRLSTVRSASDGLLAVINDVLDFSKIEAGEMPLENIEFDVVEVLERVVGIFDPLARARGVSLYAQFDLAILQKMRGDPTRVGQILNNLLSNAIKFTQQGTVTVSAHIDADETGVCTLHVAVADTGIGIAQEHLARLFRAFSQVDESINRRFGGTGLGLTLCKRLLHAMGGSIDVASEPGAGSRFTVHLPLGKGLARVEETREFAGQRVLFLTSEQNWCTFAVPHIERWGAAVEVYRHPAAIDDDALEDAALLVIWGERVQWHADDENRLVEGARWVIDGYPEGPTHAIRTGKVLSVSCLSLSGLKASCRAALLGVPLPGPQLPQGSQLQHAVVDQMRSLQVLIVEDNAVNRLLLCEQLTSLGCSIKAASNGREALDLLDDEPWDLVLTDLNMPGMSGYELAEVIRRIRPSLPIMAITAHATTEERERCQAAKMVQVLIKPLSLQQLSDTLQVFASERGIQMARPRKVDDTSFRGNAMPQQLRETFVKASGEALSLIDEAQAAHDTGGIVAQLHSIRGALAVFGYAQLAEVCARVETALKRNGDADMTDELDDFKAALRDLLKEAI